MSMVSVNICCAWLLIVVNVFVCTFRVGTRGGDVQEISDSIVHNAGLRTMVLMHNLALLPEQEPMREEV